MNHCVICGRRVSTGRTHPTGIINVIRCELCQTAERLRDWRYVSPAMKRWQKKKGVSA